MTGIEIEQSRRRFEIVGSVACALSLGLTIWALGQDSLGPITTRDRLNLLPYLLLSLGCYLGMFQLLDRYVVLPPKGIRANWAAIALFGTMLSFTIGNVPLWWKHGSLTGEYLLAAFTLCGILCLVMLGVMAFFWTLGFTVRLIRREREEAKVVPD